MTDVIDHEGFRSNVAIVLMRDNGQVFVGRRTGGRGWQVPQGGLQQDETADQAVYRELEEEVGLTSVDVDLVGSTADWLRYQLPSRFVRRNQLPLCIGQKQRWFLFRVKDNEVRFDLMRHAEPEFDRWRWVEYWEPVRTVIYFKRGVYSNALTQLAPMAFPTGIPGYPHWWDEVTASASNARRRAGRRSS